MSPQDFIEAAIKAGSTKGVTALDADERLVFLVSEAEVLCDMEGIDSFLDQYGQTWLNECADAFDEVGAIRIAAALRQIKMQPTNNDAILEEANQLITHRVGYDSDSIEKAVELRLVRRAK